MKLFKKNLKFKWKIKEIFKKTKKLFKDKNFYNVLLFGIPFILFDIVTRIFTNKVGFFSFVSLAPMLFTIIWVYFIIGVSVQFKKNIGKIILNISFIIGLIIYFVNNVYYSITGSLFDFVLIELAGEGSEYLLDSVLNANIWIYILSLIPIVLFIIFKKNIKYSKNNQLKHVVFIMLMFIFIHTCIPLFYGEANKELTWNTWKNPRNVYNNFNDNNKSYRISGLYEYTVRNFYITYLKEKKTDNETEKEFLNEIFSEIKTNDKNKHTGKFKGKNIIFLQFEGIDDWILTKEHMPNTYALLNNSINFNNHYSYYNGGGSTFNSEFAVNTGYVTPLTYTQNAYTFNKNDFPYSMAKIFKNLDYSVNGFHMNSGEYYSRKINYLTWGYDNYFSLKDQNIYKNNEYELDTELINNELFYENLFKQEGNFINYLITFTNHTPFNKDKGSCKAILTRDESDLLETELTEEDCVYIQAKETDDMVGLLMQGLKDNGLFDKTIIVGYSDHYLYTLSDNEILNKYKDTETNLVNHTPFFIWSNKLKKENVNKVTSQIDILPTVLNLMGISYNPNHYTGKDIFSNSTGIAIFNDFSWYDGKHYFKDGEIIIGNKKDMDIAEERSSYVDYIIKKNDLVLKYNYFKQVKQAELKDLN